MLTVGQSVRIAEHVRRNAWGVPCNWGGMQARIRGSGGRSGGVRLYVVGFDDCDTTSTFADCVLEPIAPPAAQPDLFAGSGQP